MKNFWHHKGREKSTNKQGLYHHPSSTIIKVLYVCLDMFMMYKERKLESKAVFKPWIIPLPLCCIGRSLCPTLCDPESPGLHMIVYRLSYQGSHWSPASEIGLLPWLLLFSAPSAGYTWCTCCNLWAPVEWMKYSVIPQAVEAGRSLHLP